MKIIKDQIKVKNENDFRMELTGQFMALFANANRNEKEKPTPFIREDFFKLSYDKPDKEDDTLSHEEQFKKIKGQLGGRIKHVEQ